MITSLTNKTVKDLTRLHQKKYRIDSFLLCDHELVEKAYENGYLKQLIYTDKKTFDFDNCLEVSQEVLNKIAQKDGLSYLGVSKMINENDDYQKRVVILDQLQDPLNVGRILESAYLFNFDSVILSENCADIYNEKCVNNSKGAFFHLNIHHGNLIEEINKLRDKGFKIYATGLSDNTYNISDLSNEDKMAFVLGNEGSGVSENIMKICNKTIKIDMHNIDSLNVAMAAAIVLYKFKRQP